MRKEILKKVVTGFLPLGRREMPTWTLPRKVVLPRVEITGTAFDMNRMLFWAKVPGSRKTDDDDDDIDDGFTSLIPTSLRLLASLSILQKFGKEVAPCPLDTED
jgi:hypothetical protein